MSKYQHQATSNQPEELFLKACAAEHMQHGSKSLETCVQLSLDNTGLSKVKQVPWL